ncbi:peptide/nickel transport system substrate-binding protein [Desulfacinum infernum DSM 9756]|uniref:Peptide/nickel transport system substrate-binding protein n=1 Tax=Desulfacinum infernum DSM 9756 TaxID=1121391 RepID=A0A1M5HI93_9BACT|nr:ABC transporter substrate-binding protein [Desulfacinum infernum]SHG15621.1 peptide/nickel transport system substrate-binding protein [Desulfacinum infernum DSM 9756]
MRTSIRAMTLLVLLLCFPMIPSHGHAEGLAKEQVLTIAFDAGDAKTFDPHRAASTVDRSTVDSMFNGLVRYPPGRQVGFEPDLAESWEVSKDGKTWTFHLRKGVYFHPFPGFPEGYELTSEDVVYSLQRAANPEHSAYAGEYEGVQVKAVDPYTLQIQIAKPISETLFLAKFANYAGGFIVSKKALETKGEDWFKTHPVGTGPFRFENYEPQQKTVLARHDKYFRGKPILEKVVIRYMPNVSSREFGLRTGELQIIEGLNEAKWIEKVATFPDVKVQTFGPCEVQMLHFNMTKKPFDDIRVRKAFCYAVSRAEVAAFMGESLAEPIYSGALAPPAPGALTKQEAEEAGVVYEDNVEMAKKLLAEAGYPNGFETEVIISELATSYRKPMVALQAQVKKAGINMKKLKVVDHSSFHGLIRDDASPLVYYACWRPNVDVFLTRFFHSDSTVVSGKKPDTNFSHYGTVDADGDGTIDTIDQLIEQARWELDAQKQADLWRKAQIQLLSDVSHLPVIRLKYAFPMKSYVDLGHPLEYSWQTYSPQITEKTRILAH